MLLQAPIYPCKRAKCPQWARASGPSRTLILVLLALAKGPGEMGLSSITDKQREAAWRVEFQALGEQLVFGNVKQGAIYNDEAKRQAALRWLSERDRLAQLAWGAFFAAIAGL